MSENKTTWSSKLGFIMAATGAAVGLGNIWMFPYVAGVSGGFVFVAVYFLCLLAIGIPALMAEVTIGVIGKQNPFDTLTKLSDKYAASKYWKILAIIGSITLFMVLSFYSVVSGWSLTYLVYSMTESFTIENIPMLWSALMSSPIELLVYHSIFMLLTIGIVAKGVNKGIEAYSKFMIPALLLMLLFLNLYGLLAGNMLGAVQFLFSFDLSKLTGEVILAAVGQSFFTLAIGAGCMLVYGTYVPAQTNVAKSMTIMALVNLLISLLAGLAIFSIVFAYDLSPAQGPSLIFETLPIAFGKMAGGNLLASLFFILLLFAALTSSISLLEPLVSILTEKFRINRSLASCIIGGLAWLTGIGALLSFNIWQDVKLYKLTIFDILTELPTRILLPLGVLGYSVFAAWVLPKDKLIKACNIQHDSLKICWIISIKYIVPTAIFTVLIATLINS